MGNGLSRSRWLIQSIVQMVVITARAWSLVVTGSNETSGAGTGPGPDPRTGARDGLASQNTESVESDLPVETTEEGPL